MFVDTAWSLFPPFIAIGLAVLTRRVFLALGVAILSGAILLEGSPWSGLWRFAELVVKSLNDANNALVILFTFAVGSLVSSMQSLGGIRGFLNWLDRSGKVDSPRSARLFAWMVGVVFFVESKITIMVAGALARPLFDRFKISREKLAYLIDSTAAPVCLVIPFNAWGAYVVGILGSLGEERPVALFAHTIIFNFYSLFAVLLSLMVAVFDLNIGPMRAAEERTRAGKVLFDGAKPMMDENLWEPLEDSVRPTGWLMLAPIMTLMVGMPLSLFITGNGDLRAGKGGLSVFLSALAGLAVLWAMSLRKPSHGEPAYSLRELINYGSKGARGMLPLALIILLALTLGTVTKELGTGAFLARVVGAKLSVALFLPAIFLVASAVAFATGTSWGTFAIMVPVALPAAAAFGVAKAPFLAAALSGGIFGDHASPISDTTIMASMAAVTDHADHVRTQLPYALLSGLASVIAYFLVGTFIL